MTATLSLIGHHVPDFTAPMTSGKTFSSAEHRGQVVVMYFYPKDDTPGCTTEGQEFRDAYTEFKTLGAEIVGVSRDTLKSHERFKEKMAFPFELISDVDEHLCALFNVMKLKNMYGKQVRGVDRSTFVIDREGVVRAELRNVKVPGHAAQVLALVQNLR